MAGLPKPPQTFLEFAERFPKLMEGWEALAEAGRVGPLDERTIRLVKLGIAIGAMREGAVHASVRKARALDIPDEALEQVVALAAGTIGLPATVAVWSWTRDRG
jgi:alkylhydroperoxidase/carboxymuconolactone decarboxylase family protein YurZ